jgi:hypothetical protein
MISLHWLSALCRCHFRWYARTPEKTTRPIDELTTMASLSSKLVEMDRPSLPIEVEEGLGRRSAVAEAILWAEQETEILMFAISCLLLANYESLQL